MPLKAQVTSAKLTFPSKKHVEGNMHQKRKWKKKKKKFDDAKSKKIKSKRKAPEYWGFESES